MAVDPKDGEAKDESRSLRPPSDDKPDTPKTSTRRLMMASSDIPAPPNPASYAPDEIILYGVKLNAADNSGRLDISEGHEPINEAPNVRIRLYTGNTAGTRDNYAIAVVYSYSFEGHCYRLDRPKVLLFWGADDAPAEGCGFEPPPDLTTAFHYRMWRVRMKTRILELTTRVDLAEKLILEDNLPGKRAPNTYNGEMLLAHRGGRLTRTGGA